MKRFIALLLLCTLFMTGCETPQKQVDTPTSNEEPTESSPEELQESASPEETIIEVSPEELAREAYEELLANYEGTSYKNPQIIEYVPRVGETFAFTFCDTITSVEDIGGYKPYFGDYIVHFNSDTNDFLVRDSGYQSSNPLSESAFYKLCNETLSSLHQTYEAHPEASDENGNAFRIDYEAGMEIESFKSSMITSVKDTGISYDGKKYFEVDNGYGLVNLVGVSEDQIPDSEFPLYEPGYFEENTYYNTAYNIKLSAEKEKSRYASIWSYYGKYTEIHESVDIDKEGVIAINFITYEFTNESKAQAFNLIGERNSTFEVLEDEVIIAGKSYHRAEKEDEYSKNETHVLLWRCEGNKVYSIYIPYVKNDKWIGLLSPLSEE